jgi:UDP-N-acetylglucosamine transferase subunit ALG13
MIFVTVGTHEQPFNRLIEYMDQWAEIHDEKVVIQTGYSTYEPRFSEWEKFYPYQEMQKRVRTAKIVITHGGPSSFVMPLQIGKIPIVVPRQVKYKEHVNNHQVEFCREVKKRMNNIILVENINQLSEIIEDYKETDNNVNKGNNAAFCRKLEKLVEGMMNDCKNFEKSI